MPLPHTSCPANADCPWDQFDPEWYVNHNYHTLREDDKHILELMRDFFAKSLAGRQLGRGLDLGTGANLYPALAMLPFCEEITLMERGAANRRWLRSQISGPEGYSQSWDPFWETLAKETAYAQCIDPRKMLGERARVEYGDVFQLGQRQFDMGTMFFVAESITARLEEFQEATQRFVGSLRIGAPFAAAFMNKSDGYTVGNHRFPAVAVTEEDVTRCLSEVAEIAKLVLVRSNKPLREGYQGMFLALGKAEKVNN